MGRKSKLTDDDWTEVGLRLFAGWESQRAIARRFGISESSLRAHASKFGRASAVSGVAWMLHEADRALRGLSSEEQITARCLADQMRSV